MRGPTTPTSAWWAGPPAATPIHLGGRRLGNRLGFLYQEGVPLERIVATLLPLLAYFKQDRREGESFGDFCHRTGLTALAKHQAG